MTPRRKLFEEITQAIKMQEELLAEAYHVFGFWLNWEDLQMFVNGSDPSHLFMKNGYDHDRNEIKRIIEKVFACAFGEDATVVIGNGHHNYIVVQIVSDKFEDMPQHIRQNFALDILESDNTGLSPKERSLVSSIICQTRKESDGEANG